MAWILISTILISMSGLIAYLYFLEKGQFDDVEEIKYQMFRQEKQEEEDAEVP